MHFPLGAGAEMLCPTLLQCRKSRVARKNITGLVVRVHAWDETPHELEIKMNGEESTDVAARFVLASLSSLFLLLLLSSSPPPPP